MTAAIYAAKANLKTTIVDTDICGGLVNSTYMVENFPSYPAIHGIELMQKVQNHVASLGIHIEEVAEISHILLNQDQKEIHTDEARYVGGAAILATGRDPVPLDIETSCEQVHYCSICDGTAYKGKRVIVVGGGNSGFDEALYLLSIGAREIVLIEQMDRFFATRSAQNKLLECAAVTAKLSTRIISLICDQKIATAVLENVQTRHTERIETDGIFVFLGQKPATNLFSGMVDLDEHGYILVNENLETNIRGVYAAGDVIPKRYRQITTAMADGTIAALNAAEYLNSMRYGCN